MASQHDTIRAAIEAWNRHDRDEYITAYRDDVALHGFPDGVVDAGSLGDFFAGMWQAVPDATITLDDVVTEGDRSALRITLRGTHEGELMGVPASNRPIEMSILTIMRFDDDARCVERWNVADFLTMLQQIGGIPAPA